MHFHKRGDVSSRYIPKDSREVRDEASDAVVYLGERDGMIYGVAYCGKRAKPDWSYRFRSEVQRDVEVRRFFEARRESLADKAEAKRTRR